MKCLALIAKTGIHPWIGNYVKEKKLVRQFVCAAFNIFWNNNSYWGAGGRGGGYDIMGTSFLFSHNFETLVHAMWEKWTSRKTYSMSPGTQGGPCYESEMNHQNNSQFVSVAASNYCLLQLHHPHALAHGLLVVILKQKWHKVCETGNILKKSHASHSHCWTYVFLTAWPIIKPRENIPWQAIQREPIFKMIYYETACWFWNVIFF